MVFMSFMTIKDIFRHKKSEKGALRPMKSEKDIKRRFIGRVEMKAAQAEKLLDIQSLSKDTLTPERLSKFRVLQNIDAAILFISGIFFHFFLI